MLAASEVHVSFPLPEERKKCKGDRKKPFNHYSGTTNSAFFSQLDQIFLKKANNLFVIILLQSLLRYNACFNRLIGMAGLSCNATSDVKGLFCWKIAGRQCSKDSRIINFLLSHTSYWENITLDLSSKDLASIGKYQMQKDLG